MTARARPRSRKPRRGLTLEGARRLALALPGAVEGPCYGTPGYRVRGKLFARLHEDGETVVVGVDREVREGLLRANPRAFSVTAHYEPYDWMLVRLSAVTSDELGDMLRQAWERRAPKKLRLERER
ncbi:MAG TPA: MmcQ/YjbR family DNA-binding protein [Thermoanaerobaculia bacterium]|nr:MmcQ/YjbR family DNA-binding protein [Thermoanaerobaculia bacterium]